MENIIGFIAVALLGVIVTWLGGFAKQKKVTAEKDGLYTSLTGDLRERNKQLEMELRKEIEEIDKLTAKVTELEMEVTDKRARLEALGSLDKVAQELKQELLTVTGRAIALQNEKDRLLEELNNKNNDYWIIKNERDVAIAEKIGLSRGFTALETILNMNLTDLIKLKEKIDHVTGFK